MPFQGYTSRHCSSPESGMGEIGERCMGSISCPHPSRFLTVIAPDHDCGSSVEGQIRFSPVGMRDPRSDPPPQMMATAVRCMGRYRRRAYRASASPVFPVAPCCVQSRLAAYPHRSLELKIETSFSKFYRPDGGTTDRYIAPDRKT